VIQNNVLGVLRCDARRTATHATRRRRQQSSTSGQLRPHGLRSGAVYCAAKAGNCKSPARLRMELNGTGIRVGTGIPASRKRNVSLVRFKGRCRTGPKCLCRPIPPDGGRPSRNIGSWVASRPPHVKHWTTCLVKPVDRRRCTRFTAEKKLATRCRMLNLRSMFILKIPRFARHSTPHRRLKDKIRRPENQMRHKLGRADNDSPKKMKL